MLPTSEDIAKKLEVLIKEWMKGDIPESEYLPFDLLLLELAAFQVAPHHPLIDFFTEFVKKISATVIFAMLYIHIYVVAVLYLHSEDFRECVCQFLHYWYNCRCREHTRVRPDNKQKYQKTMIRLLLRQKIKLKCRHFHYLMFLQAKFERLFRAKYPSQKASNICGNL